MLTMTRANAVRTAIPGLAHRPPRICTDLPDCEDRVDERRHEQPDRKLARLVLQNTLDDAGRELRHGELHHYHGDRQDQSSEADHGRGDCFEDAEGRLRPADQAGGQRLVVERAVQRERRKRKGRAADHTEYREEPQARAQMAAKPVSACGCWSWALVWRQVRMSSIGAMPAAGLFSGARSGSTTHRLVARILPIATIQPARV